MKTTSKGSRATAATASAPSLTMTASMAQARQHRRGEPLIHDVVLGDEHTQPAAAPVERWPSRGPCRRRRATCRRAPRSGAFNARLSSSCLIGLIRCCGHAELAAARRVAGPPIRGQHQDGGAADAVSRLQLAHQRESIHAGHVHVDQHDVEPAGPARAQRLRPGAGRPLRPPPSSRRRSTGAAPRPGCGGSCRCRRRRARRQPARSASGDSGGAADERAGIGERQAQAEAEGAADRPARSRRRSTPPISPTIRFEMARPRPVPPNRRDVVPSSCAKASKMSACLSGAMPMPVSRTAKRSAQLPATGSASSTHATSTVTSPASVNLMALPTRLMITWRSRSASPTIASGTSGATRQASSSDR